MQALLPIVVAERSWIYHMQTDANMNKVKTMKILDFSAPPRLLMSLVISDLVDQTMHSEFISDSALFRSDSFSTMTSVVILQPPLAPLSRLRCTTWERCFPVLYR